MRGLGDDPARATAALGGLAAARTKLLLVLLALLVAMFAMMSVLKRG
jgi:hypothetical protein